jgi:hypothetical protein
MNLSFSILNFGVFKIQAKMQVLKSSYLKVQRVFKYRQKKQARKLPFFSKSRHTKQHKHHSSRSCHIIQVQAQGPVLKVFSFYVQIQEAVLMLLFLPTLSTRINPQSLQLVLWLIFSLKNNKMKQRMLCDAPKMTERRMFIK